MTKRKPIIQVPPGSVEKIMKSLNCKRTIVYAALAYDSNSDLAEKIRKDAVDFYGGIKTTKLVMR